jgi:hypothetical protein
LFLYTEPGLPIHLSLNPSPGGEGLLTSLYPMLCSAFILLFSYTEPGLPVRERIKTKNTCERSEQVSAPGCRDLPYGINVDNPSFSADHRCKKMQNPVNCNVSGFFVSMGLPYFPPPVENSVDTFNFILH